MTVATAIIGRERELYAVERFLDPQADGVRALVVEGEAGIGKTTIWREALAAAEGRSYRVLQARPAESEARLSYAGLSDLVGPIFAETRGALPPPQQLALERALLRTGSALPADPRTIATGLVSVLAAARSQILVAVDDVQWLDRATERALEFAARRLPNGARLLVTRRSTGDATLPLGLERALPERVERLVLGPLSLASLHHLLADRLGRALPRPTLVRLEQASGGNPFFALELARALGPDWKPSLGEALPVPADLHQLVARRIRRLPPETREALLVVSALTRPTTADVGEAELGPAEDAGIVRIRGRRVEFVHPLFGSAVYGAARSAHRRQVHARLAERAGDLEERASHLALATVRPDETVARLLDAAAAQARERGAPDAAAQLQERAAELTPAQDRRAVHARRIQAAAHSVRAGDLSKAEALLEETLAQQPHVVERADALRLLGELRYSERSFPEAIPLLEEALDLAHAPAAAVQIKLDLAFAYNGIHERERADRHVADAVAHAGRLHLDPLLADALAVAAMIDHMAGRGIDRAKLARALELEEPDRQDQLSLQPSSIAGMLAVADGRLDEAVGLLGAIRKRAVAGGKESDLPLLLGYLALAQWMRGDYAAAAEVADDLIRISAQAGNEPMRGLGLVHRAWVTALRGGDADSIRADAEEARTLIGRSGWTVGASYVPMLVGFLELSLGDAEAAAKALSPLVDAFERGVVAEPELSHWAPHAIDALISLGDIAQARRLVEALERKGRELSGAWASTEGARGRSTLLAAQGDLEGALAAIEDAVASAESLEMPFVVARTYLGKGRLHRRRREKRLARECLEEALRIFEQLGAPRFAEQARAELERVGLRRSSPDELSATERRIAELAAQGLTNREVAQAVFVSPKTVEANLARVYRKLGIASRAELGARMSG